MTTKLRIGIFGDSYADERASVDLSAFENGRLPWGRYLRQLTDHDITNFALAGSSLQYSAKLFLENYKDFDKVIFVVTFPGRFYLSTPDIDPGLRHIANLDHLFSKISEYKEYIKLRVWDCTTPKLEKAMPYLSALRDYYLYLYDYDQSKLFHDALFEKLENTLPKESMLILPANKEVTPRKWEQDTFSEISQLDTVPTNCFTADNRENHLNDANNKLLARKINHWIDTGEFKLAVSDFLPETEAADQLWTIIDEPRDFKNDT
jgi:hypothetical protein